jgi:GNAT superfamily N-acetyltransferase
LRSYDATHTAGEPSFWKVQKQLAGYALLIPFWSNELGGSICEVDELFVIPERRSQGHGTALFEAIANGVLWPTAVVGIALGVTPDNSRARRLYERLGFAAVGVSMVYRIT